MTATAEAYGFGARAPYAQPREPEYDMKERVRLSGLFPRVRNQPMSTQLQALLKEFENNAALTGILERRRRLEERLQFELKGKEGMDALNTNLAPVFRAGLAGAATSASVADRLARSKVAGQLAAAVAANAPPAQEAEAVMTGAVSLTPAQRKRVNAAMKKAAAKAAAEKAAAAAAAAQSGVGVSQEGGSSGSGDGMPVFKAGVAGVQPKAMVLQPPPGKTAPKTPTGKAGKVGSKTERSPSTSRTKVV